MNASVISFTISLLIYASPVSAGEYFYYNRWQCGQWRVDIRVSDGTLTATQSGKRRLVIPYGSAMSSHQAWNSEGYSECDGVAGPCAIGGKSDEGIYLYLIPALGAKSIECTRRR